MADPSALVAALVDGDRRALARALSIVDRGGAAGDALCQALPRSTTPSRIVGFTGVGGAGKSTLIAALIGAARERGLTVAVLAMDPASVIGGGALLGDRVRMEEYHADSSVFVRSVAARGNAGGISRSTASALAVLGAAGFDAIYVESIGAGQDQIDLARLVETLVLVEAPNLGDDVQALKSGMREHADIIVVAKSDLPGADATVAVLTANARDEAQSTGIERSVVRVSAYTGDGIAGLLDRLLEPPKPNARRESIPVAQLRTLVADEAAKLALEALDDASLTQLQARINADPGRARQIAREWLIDSRR